MMRGLGPLSRAMLLGFLRDRTALFFTVVFPLMFLVLFGGLFRFEGSPRADVLQIGAVPVLDSLPTDIRSEVDKVLKVERRDNRDDALEAVRDGDVAAAIEQRGDQVIVHFSGADQTGSATVRSVLDSVAQYANLQAAGAPARFSVLPERVEDESLKAIQFVTPGLLGWAIATSAMFSAAITLVAWRKKKILRRLRLSPVRTPAIVAARVAMSVVIAIIQFCVFVGIALIPYFGLKLTGSWWMAIPLLVAGTLAFLSLGLLVGAWAKTEETANAATNIIVLPMAFLSGSFFPIDMAPGWLQALSNIFPLKHLNQAMLDVMVRGQGPASALPAILGLLAFAVVVSALATRLFRWDDV